MWAGRRVCCSGGRSGRMIALSAPAKSNTGRACLEFLRSSSSSRTARRTRRCTAGSSDVSCRGGGRGGGSGGGCGDMHRGGRLVRAGRSARASACTRAAAPARGAAAVHAPCTLRTPRPPRRTSGSSGGSPPHPPPPIRGASSHACRILHTADCRLQTAYCTPQAQCPHDWGNSPQRTSGNSGGSSRRSARSSAWKRADSLGVTWQPAGGWGGRGGEGGQARVEQQQQHTALQTRASNFRRPAPGLPLPRRPPPAASPAQWRCPQPPRAPCAPSGAHTRRPRRAAGSARRSCGARGDGVGVQVRRAWDAAARQQARAAPCACTRIAQLGLTARP